MRDKKEVKQTQFNTDKAVSFNGDFEIVDKKDSILRYVINGVLMFYISYGCIGTFASAFEIEHFKIMLFFVMLILAVLYSFMHINETTHKIGYGCILLCYVYMILRMKTIIKSGFATIINVTLQVIQEKLDLARIKQYTEYVDETELAVTMCLIVIGFVLLLVLNILVSEYMNAIATIVLTAPIVIACYYFEQKPDMMQLVMYIAGIIGLLVMRLNTKSTVYSNENVYYVDDEEQVEKKYIYVVANKMHAHLLLIVIVSVTMLSGVFSLVLQNSYKNSFFVKTFVKEALDEKVTNMVTDTGGGGSKKAASGGLSKGKLGTVANIEYDNKTDLKVKYVPNGLEPIYLRGYIGSVYEENCWKMLSKADNERYYSLSREIEDLYNVTPNQRADYMFELLDNSITGIFTVENIDANGEYAFLPYYAELNDKCMEARSDDEMYMTVNALSYEVRFHQKTESTDEKIDGDELAHSTLIDRDMEQYYDNLKAIYTVVPSRNKDMLHNVIKSLGLSKKESYTNEEINEAVGKVQEYYRKSFVYTLNPGETPEGQDFVNYFLESKTGFCAHYASAATMLLRYMGIPTRYVEGYVISSDLISEGKKINGEEVRKYTSNYREGESFLVEVEVPDNKAHAWIEVYKENFGWVPYEVTVYNRKEEGNVGGQRTVAGEMKKLKENLLESGRKTLFIVTIMMGIALVVIIIAIFRFVGKRYSRNKKFKNKNKSLAIYYVYSYLCDVMGFFGVKREKGMTIDEYFVKVFDKVFNKGEVNLETLTGIAKCIKKAAYSNEEIVQEDYEYVKSQVENIVKIQYNELSLKEKIKFKLIYNL
ncbi:MAG: transglutaminase domain-containing protein [Lachnospiraceae bacterium]|nr:transglutaminase domain-containing protein [Lachnospiraceae bacterium]